MKENVNSVTISGIITKVYPNKHTINNVPILSFILEHKSQQYNNNTLQIIFCKLLCIKLGSNKESEVFLDKNVLINGFLGYNYKKELVLHVNEMNFL